MTGTDLLESVRADRSSIASLDVAHVDSKTLTPIPIAPETLDARDGAYREHTADRAIIGELLDLIERSAPEANEHGGALRWKLTFRDAGENALLEVWHHNFEGYGRIGSTQVKFADTSILDYLHAHFDPES
jgi:hypothetical protein